MTMKEILKTYVKKTVRSREKYKELSKIMPGAVGSAIRWFSPYPFFVEKAEGAWITDADGNQYIDYIMGQGPLLFGHANPRSVIEALKQQLEKGCLYGTPTAIELIVAKKIKELIPCAEKVAFANSGTEAVMHAIMVARAYMKKKKIIKFEGVYNGHYPEIWVSVTPPLEKAGPYENPTPVPSSDGIPENSLCNLIILPWNNSELLEKAVKNHKEELAAVLLAPVNTGSGVIPPKNDFLKTLREVTEDNGVPLIFDEIITGFRLTRGGAQEYYEVIPDLAVYGKILGGGMPIGAICGKTELMDLTDPSLEKNVKTPIVGTFNTNPISMVAAAALLDEIKNDKGLYQRLNTKCTTLVNEMRNLIEELGIKACIEHVGSVFQIYFTDQEEIIDYRSAARTDKAVYNKFFMTMLTKGIFLSSRAFGRCFTSTAHCDGEFSKTLQATEESLRLCAHEIRR